MQTVTDSINTQANKLADILHSQGYRHGQIMTMSRIDWELAATLAGLGELTQSIAIETANIMKIRETFGAVRRYELTPELEADLLYEFKASRFGKSRFSVVDYNRNNDTVVTQGQFDAFQALLGDKYCKECGDEEVTGGGLCEDCVRGDA